MKKLVAVLVLAAVGGVAYYYYVKSKTVEPPQVLRAAVTQGDVTEYVQATGTLSAVRVMEVGSQVSGIVKGLYALPPVMPIG
jgi:HlyD family secretion protein